MKTLITHARGGALAALFSIAAVPSAVAYNQDYFFTHKVISDQHSGVQSIGIGPDDKIYVADYNNSRFAIYDAELNFLNYVTGFRPHDLVVDKNGIIYAADVQNQKVRRFDSSGVPLSDLLTSFAAHYVRIHPTNGNLYIKDSGGNYRVVAPDGTLVKSFALPDSTRYEVLPDGRLHLFNGQLYNDLGILEKSGLGSGQDLRYHGGRCYGSHENRGGFMIIWDANFAEISRIAGAYWYWPNFGYRFNLNQKGDIIGSDHYTLFLLRRSEPASMGPVVRNATPVAEVLTIAQRPNTTLLDIDYRVTDMDDATVHTAAAAFIGNTNSLDNLILLSTLEEGTAANLGIGIPRNTEKRITWDVGSDWDADFGDLSVHIFARDSRPHLMGLHLLSLPADGSVPAMQITRTPLNKSWFLEPLIWLAASGNTTVVFSKSGTTGNLHGTDNAPEGFRGELLASGNTVTQKGWQFIASLMGCREATTQEVQAAREAATPGIVNKWDFPLATGEPSWKPSMMKKIMGDQPRKVNEYSFDTGDYDSNWIWLIKN
jgi:hypothetical protein